MHGTPYQIFELIWTGRDVRAGARLREQPWRRLVRVRKTRINRWFYPTCKSASKLSHKLYKDARLKSLPVDSLTFLHCDSCVFKTPFSLGGIHLLRSQNFRDFRPPPPFICISRNLSVSIIRIFGQFLNPPSPLGANVINGSPLNSNSQGAVIAPCISCQYIVWPFYHDWEWPTRS